jgi:hypothetical protein
MEVSNAISYVCSANLDTSFIYLFICLFFTYLFIHLFNIYLLIFIYLLFLSRRLLDTYVYTCINNKPNRA